jgi:hypothetical protein
MRSLLVFLKFGSAVHYHGDLAETIYFLDALEELRAIYFRHVQVKKDVVWTQTFSKKVHGVRAIVRLNHFYILDLRFFQGNKKQLAVVFVFVNKKDADVQDIPFDRPMTCNTLSSPTVRKVDQKAIATYICGKKEGK